MDFGFGFALLSFGLAVTMFLVRSCFQKNQQADVDEKRGS